MASEPASVEIVTSMEDNLKKATTEMILLYLLSEKDCYIAELTESLNKRSNGAFQVVFPYGAIYRLLENGCVYEKEKRNAPDGRRRQFFSITDKGREYLKRLLLTYHVFFDGLQSVLFGEGTEHAQ